MHPHSGGPAGGRSCRNRLFADLREGLAYIRRHGFLRALFVFICVIHVLNGPLVFLAPLQVARSTYGEEVWRLSAIEIGFSVGMLVGGVLMASWGGFPNRLHTLALANFTFGLAGIVLGVSPAFVVYVATMALVGIVLPLYNTATTVMFQERVEDAFRGRIFGVNAMVSTRSCHCPCWCTGRSRTSCRLRRSCWSVGR